MLEGDNFIKRFCNSTGLKKPQSPLIVYLDPKNKGKNEVFPVPKWIQGFYSTDKKIIVIKVNREYNIFIEDSFLSVFKHEIVHSIVDLNNLKLPRWFEEGLASSYSKGFTVKDGRTLLTYDNDNLINSLKDSSFYNHDTAVYTYALSSGIISYLRELGHTNINEILKKTKNEDFETAFSSTLGIPINTFLTMFRENFLSRYTVLSLAISEQGLYALMLILAIYAIFRKRYLFKQKLKEMEKEELLEQEKLIELQNQLLIDNQTIENSKNLEKFENIE